MANSDESDKKKGELCSCGHVHKRKEKCTALISGVGGLNFCVCTGCLPNGEHMQVSPPLRG